MIDIKLIQTGSLLNNEYFNQIEDLIHYKNNGPSYAKPGDAGVDLRAVIDTNIILNPGEKVLISSGFKIYIGKHDIPFNVSGLIMPRSGLGHKYGIILGNSTGVVDSEYQSVLLISLKNDHNENYLIKPGDKIAQMLFVPVLDASFSIVDSFEVDTERGAGGFGSTGV